MIQFLMMKALLFGLALAFGTLIQGAEARPQPDTLDQNQIKRLVVAEAEAPLLELMSTSTPWHTQDASMAITRCAPAGAEARAVEV